MAGVKIGAKIHMMREYAQSHLPTKSVQGMDGKKSTEEAHNVNFVTVKEGNEEYEVFYQEDKDPIHLVIEEIRAIVVEQKLFSLKKEPTQEQVLNNLYAVKVNILGFGIEPDCAVVAPTAETSLKFKKEVVDQLEEIKSLLSSKDINPEIKKAALTQIFTEVTSQSLKPSHLAKALTNLRLANTKLGQAAHEIAYCQLEHQADEFLISHPSHTTNAKFNRNYLIDSCAEKYGFKIKYKPTEKALAWALQSEECRAAFESQVESALAPRMLVLELVKISVEEVKSKCSMKTKEDKVRYQVGAFKSLTKTALYTGLSTRELKTLLGGYSEAEIFESLHHKIAEHIAKIIKQPTELVDVVKTDSCTRIVSLSDLFFSLEANDDTKRSTPTISCLSKVDLASIPAKQAIALIHQFINQTTDFDELKSFCCACLWDKSGKFAAFLGADPTSASHEFLKEIVRQRFNETVMQAAVIEWSKQQTAFSKEYDRVSIMCRLPEVTASLLKVHPKLGGLDMKDPRLVEPRLPKFIEESFLQEHATEDLLQTWLYKAYERNDSKSIARLCRFGADPNRAEPVTGTFPIQAVCMGGHVELLKELLKMETCELGVVLGSQENILHLACYCGNREVVGILLKNLDPSIINGQEQHGKTALMVTAEKGDIELVKQLLESKKVAQNVYDREGRSVQHIAYDNGHIEILKALIKVSDLETLEHLDNVYRWSIGMYAIADRQFNLLGLITSKIPKAD
ncbi:ankyrin repeat domain-containing protein [Parashewanella spongiae]|nr:ankyrin repeat domain-containing protein [Parashewanella spongiae]MCL1080010.1 ankyrin repeat domain-containing protein [Parashewanella spongiae]